MTALVATNALAVLTAAWAVWVRRHSFGSRWDAPITVGVALYGIASALDSSWTSLAAVSFPLTGKHYLLAVLGQICYLAGTAAGLKSVFIRLMPDEDIGHFMKTRITPVVTIAAAVMLTCFFASPKTSTFTANYLYDVGPDNWLRVYFATFLLTFTGLLWTSLFGAVRLRAEPDSGAALPLMFTVSTGSIGCLTFLGAILTGHPGIITALAWPVVFGATAVASLACAVYWRRRLAELSRRQARTDTDRPHRDLLQ